MSGRAAFLLSVLTACSAQAAAHEQTAKRDGVVARLHVESDSPQTPSAGDRVAIRLSGELVLTLVVEAPAGVEVAAVPLITTSKVWRQRQQVTGWETTPLDSGRVRRRQVYRLSSWQAGDVPLEPAPLRFRKGGGPEGWEEIAWKPVPVVVTTVVQDADARSARAITGVEELPAPEPADGWRSAGVAGLTAAVLALAAWLLWRGRRRSTPALPPDQWALRELTRLGEPLPQAERCHTLLAEIVRRYLELRFGFQAPRQTTPEFLNAARQAPLLTSAQQALLGELLSQCDLVKFARSEPEPQDCRAALARARAFVEETRPPKAQAREAGQESCPQSH